MPWQTLRATRPVAGGLEQTVGPEPLPPAVGGRLRRECWGKARITLVLAQRLQSGSGAASGPQGSSPAKGVVGSPQLRCAGRPLPSIALLGLPAAVPRPRTRHALFALARRARKACPWPAGAPSSIERRWPCLAAGRRLWVRTLPRHGSFGCPRAKRVAAARLPRRIRLQPAQGTAAGPVRVILGPR